MRSYLTINDVLNSLLCWKTILIATHRNPFESWSLLYVHQCKNQSDAFSSPLGNSKIKITIIQKQNETHSCYITSSQHSLPANSHECCFSEWKLKMIHEILFRMSRRLIESKYVCQLRMWLLLQVRELRTRFTCTFLSPHTTYARFGDCDLVMPHCITNSYYYLFMSFGHARLFIARTKEQPAK